MMILLEFIAPPLFGASCRPLLAVPSQGDSQRAGQGATGTTDMNDPLGQDVTPAVSAGVVTSTSVTHVVLPSELVCPSAELPGVTTGWNPAGRWMPHG